MRHHSAHLRRQRQENRMKEVELLPADQKSNNSGVKAYIIFGGNLQKRLAQKPLISKRQQRTMQQAALRAAVREKMEADRKEPMSFKEVARNAALIMASMRRGPAKLRKARGRG